MKAKVSQIELEAFCHATEDEDKVITALLNLVPKGLREKAKRKIKVSHLKGYHGNPIRILKLRLSKPREAERTLTHILTSLERDGVLYILNTLEERVEGSHLYIRVDKQAAYLGSPRPLAGDDVVRVKATLSGATSPEDFAEYLESVVRPGGKDARSNKAGAIDRRGEAQRSRRTRKLLGGV